METTIRQLHIHAETRGTASDLPLVVFLHGWGCEGKIFGALLDTAGEKYPVLAPDLPGFGSSDEPPAPWSVDEYADLVCELIALNGAKEVILVGHSFGGRVIFKLASRKGLPFAISKIVLFDAAGVKPKRTLGYYRKVYTYKLGKTALSWKPVRKLFPHALEEFRSGRGSSDYANASPVMKATLSKAVNEDLSPLFPHIQPPTLLIWGTADTATPLSDALRMEKELVDAGLVRCEGAGHFSFLERPALCDAAFRSFLEI